VKKGAKGIKIIAPYKVKKKVVGDHYYVDNGDKIPVYAPGETKEDYENRIAQTTREVEYTNFRVTTVFDVSDTEGKELPTLGVNELMGSVDGYEKLKTALEETSKVPVEYGLVTSGAKGFFSPDMHKICVQSGMSEVQTVKTIIHEMAHALLHDKTDNPDLVQDPKTKNTKEVEAESIAYVVCQHFGIDTSDYSFGYIAGWSSGKETKELKASMDTIRVTASKMIVELESAMEKQQEAEKKDVAMAVAESSILVVGSEKMNLVDEKKTSIMDKLKSKLNIVGSQQKAEKALENKMKTPELAR
jgi:Zn-dependent peptidase ImmA (M78 family)